MHIEGRVHWQCVNLICYDWEKCRPRACKTFICTVQIDTFAVRIHQYTSTRNAHVYRQTQNKCTHRIHTRMHFLSIRSLICTWTVVNSHILYKLYCTEHDKSGRHVYDCRKAKGDIIHLRVDCNENSAIILTFVFLLFHIKHRSVQRLDIVKLMAIGQTETMQKRIAQNCWSVSLKEIK